MAIPLDNFWMLLLVVMTIIAFLEGLYSLYLLNAKRNLKAEIKALQKSKEEIGNKLDNAEETLEIEMRRYNDVLKKHDKYADLRLRIRAYRILRDHLRIWSDHKESQTQIIAKIIHDNSDLIGRMVEETWEKIRDSIDETNAKKEVERLLQHVERKIEGFQKQGEGDLGEQPGFET